METAGDDEKRRRRRTRRRRAKPEAIAARLKTGAEGGDEAGVEGEDGGAEEVEAVEGTDGGDTE